MKTQYKIIWIDDQHDEQESFIDQADREGFEIVPFKTSRDGMSYLRDNLHDVDGIILDAKVFTESTNDTPTERGLNASIKEIAKIIGENHGRDIPYVIFTGQPDLQNDSDFAEKMDGVSVFSKSSPSNKPLFEKLKSLIGDTISTSLRNRYPHAYEASHVITPYGESWRLLYPILDSFTSGKPLLSDPYNDLRKVLEHAFRYLHKYAVIHERLIENGQVNLWGSSAFLGDYPAKYGNEGRAVKAKSAVIPKLVAEQVRFVLNVCQVGSHTEGYHEIPITKPSISEVEKWNRDHHLLEIATLMTLDFIVWAKSYVTAHPDAAANMTNWELIPTSGKDSASNTECPDIECIVVEGEILSITSGGHAFVNTKFIAETEGRNVFIEKNLIKNNELRAGMRVSVSTSGKVNKDTLVAASYTCL